MKNAIIIHGAYGNGDENWFPWLKKELKKLDFKVVTPTFPTPKDQTLKNWINIFEDYRVNIDSDTILIGHSLGVPFILTILENLKFSIKSAFLVAGFTKLLNNTTFDPINKTFVEKEFQWDKIKKNCRYFEVYHSNNDPYVPIEYGENVAEKLGVKLIKILNAGHFNSDFGYEKFEKLLENIKML